VWAAVFPLHALPRTTQRHGEQADEQCNPGFLPVCYHFSRAAATFPEESAISLQHY